MPPQSPSQPGYGRLAQEARIAPTRPFPRPGGARRTVRLPETLVVEVTGSTPEGDTVARPVDPEYAAAGAAITITGSRRGEAALAPGDRVLARLRPAGRGRYDGFAVRRIADGPGRIVGLYRRLGDAGRIVPVDRRSKAEWRVPAGEDCGAESGEVVLAAPLPYAGIGLKPARVQERLGRAGDARTISALCIAQHGIPNAFPAEALAEAAEARGVAPDGREDLRGIPLVTIDGEDARDFDDAVHAGRDGDGWLVRVAIADVAHYVPLGSALDREARLRGNSTYFPDRVVPMLPEALSNGWCSLRPAEDRGCLVVEMRVGRDGRKKAHRFGRGLMRSAARLTYVQVQAAMDAGDPLGLGTLLPDLYGAFRALLAARRARGTLDLDLPERKVVLGADGHVASVMPRPRLDSHRLIEEFMVLANVAAAEELEERRRSCVYRVHAPPSEEKLDTLRGFLRGFDISLPASNAIRPADLDRALAKVVGTDAAPLVNEVVLRSQSQAQYSAENIGHFGLALPRYAHFTSPIRRYADLLVHRSLLAGLAGGPRRGPDAAALGDLEAAAEHINATERRSTLAERDATDRYLAAYMAAQVGQEFDASVSGVARFGLFVTLADTGASGLLPAPALGDEYWAHDEAAQALVGRRSGTSYGLAQKLRVRLAEANALTGGLVFGLADRQQLDAHSATGDKRVRSGKKGGKQPSGKQPRSRRKRA